MGPNSGVKTHVDKCSLLLFIVSIIIISLIVTMGILVRLFAEETIARITLISLICILSVFGIAVLSYLEVRRRAAQKKNCEITVIAPHHAYLYNKIEPTAPTYSTLAYSGRSTLSV